MAAASSIGRSVKPWAEEEGSDGSEANYSHDAADSSGSEHESDDGSDAGKSPDPEDTESTVESLTEPEQSLNDISFGALAKAQASFTPNSRKRKLTDMNNALTEETREVYHPVYDEEGKRDANKAKSTKLSRTSKHAPTVQSSRHAVSRRREVFEPSPALKSRDPRFDVAINVSSATDRTASDRANKNYSFLSAYQASEILDLKTQIKKAKDPEVIADLKRQVMSTESKIRVAEAKQRQNEILRKHKQKEREAIKSGLKEKPYFLKQSDVKKEALVERFNSMSKKARDKAMERKRKRTKGKESKDMPRARRERVVDG